jgi:hypothetical protein
MTPSNQRRLAADARRVANNGNERETVAQLRHLMKKNYDRGVEDGREQLRNELDAADPRALLLQAGAEQLDGMGARISSVPNSARAQSAFREAAAILRDAAREGEPADAEPEKKGKAKK